MELYDLEIGTKLALEITDITHNEDRQELVSQFEWPEGDNTAVIAVPIFEGNVVPLEPDTIIDIYFLSRKGRFINLHKFRAIITDRFAADNLQFLRIEKLGDIIRIQRRSYFRLDCLADVRYRVIRSFDERYNQDTPYKETLASDLSGGGICLLLDEKLEMGCLVECKMFADQKQMVRFIGRVVRHERAGREERFKYFAGIAFLDISVKDREAIIKYIFNEQRKLLRKGMI